MSGSDPITPAARGRQRQKLLFEVWSHTRELYDLDLHEDAGIVRAEQILRALVQTGELHAVLPIASLLTAPTWTTRRWPRSVDMTRYRRLAAAARHSVAALVARLTAKELVVFDQMLRSDSARRSLCSVRGWSHWESFGPAELSASVSDDGARVPTLGTFAGHPNGYVREAAVIELAREGSDALPWLLLRANDWVLPVRQRAIAAINALVTDQHAPAFIAALPLVLRMRRLSRVNHEELVGRISELVVQQNEEALLETLRTGRRELRRALFSVLRETKRATLDVVSIALDDRDVVTRTRAARALAKREGEKWVPLQKRLCTDRLGRIRALGLELAVKRDPRDAESLLVSGLTDSHQSVREVARYHLRFLCPRLDVVEHYRSLLEKEATDASPLWRGAALGLSEVGNKDDWEHLFPLLDARPRIAGAALKAMARLNASASRETRLMMVDSPAPGVSRDAARTLRHAIWASDEEALVTYLQSPYLHVRRNAMRLLLGLPGWRGVRHLLECRERALGPLVEDLLGRWLSRYGGLAPQQKEVEWMRELVQRASFITETQRKQIEELLQFEFSGG